MAKTSKINYLVDERGERRAVVVEVAEYRRLREAAEELAAIAEVAPFSWTAWRLV